MNVNGLSRAEWKQALYATLGALIGQKQRGVWLQGDCTPSLLALISWKLSWVKRRPMVRLYSCRSGVTGLVACANQAEGVHQAKTVNP